MAIFCKEFTMNALIVSRRLRMVVMGLVLAAAGSVALTAVARPGPGGGPGHGMDGGLGFLGGPHLGRLLDSVGATEAQRTQIRQITQAAAADLKTQRESGRSLREQGLQLFTQPTVDANAVEALRQQMLQQHDQASRRMSQAMIDVSKVLTPEQRAKLGAQLKSRQDMMQRHMRERRQLDSAPSN
jgi:protein CpxP